MSQLIKDITEEISNDVSLELPIPELLELINQEKAFKKRYEEYCIALLFLFYYLVKHQYEVNESFGNMNSDNPNHSCIHLFFSITL